MLLENTLFGEIDKIKISIYKKKYILAFDNMLKNINNPSCNWKNGLEVFNWWLNENNNKQLDGQLEMIFDDENVIDN